MYAVYVKGWVADVSVRSINVNTFAVIELSTTSRIPIYYYSGNLFNLTRLNVTIDC